MLSSSSAKIGKKWPVRASTLYLQPVWDSTLEHFEQRGHLQNTTNLQKEQSAWINGTYSAGKSIYMCVERGRTACLCAYLFPCLYCWETHGQESARAYGPWPGWSVLLESVYSRCPWQTGLHCHCCDLKRKTQHHQAGFSKNFDVASL